MKYAIILSIFLCSVSIKPMEKISMENVEASTKNIVVTNMVYQIAQCRDELASRAEDLRNMGLVCKSWNAIISNRTPQIIILLTNSLNHPPEIAQVIAAITLGTQGSRTWLKERYSDEEMCKALLFTLVQDNEGVLYIHPLQYVHDTFNKTAEENTEELINQLFHRRHPNVIATPVKIIDEYGSLTYPLSYYDKPIPQLLLGTLNAKCARPDMVWEIFSQGHNLDDISKAKILRRLIDSLPQVVNAVRSTFSSDLFWCWALKQNLNLLILKEVFKYPNKLEEQCQMIEVILPEACAVKRGVTRISPLKAALEQERYDVMIELLKRPDFTGNEIVFDNPIIIWATKNGNIEMVQCLLKKKTCDINVQDKDKKTPLMIALEKRFMGIIDLLLERSDLDVGKRDRRGYTAYDITCSLDYIGYDKVAKKIGDKDAWCVIM